MERDSDALVCLTTLLQVCGPDLITCSYVTDSFEEVR